MSGRALPDWLEAGRPHVWLPYAQMKTAPVPVPVARTEGSRIVLADGRELVDGVSSWWTACHGYNHPHIRAAVSAQLEAMPHVMFGGLAHEPAYRLAARLAALAPGDLDHVFFTDSGSVAVEVAAKMAIQYWINQGARGRTRLLSFRFGYHGDTMGAMSLTDPEEGMHALFKGYLPEQVFADLPRDEETTEAFDAALARHRESLAAVIVEPLVQGAGGMKMHDAATLARVAEACRRHGVLLIADEIMTGFGRTGAMFACAEAGIVPDIMCLSKALTGGTLSLAATLARRHVFEAFLSDRPDAALMHGPTFMGNPLACAAANASLDLFEREPRLAQVAAISARLAEGLAPLADLPGIVGVRVKGAIGAVQLATPDVPWFKRRFLEEGVWIRPFGDIVYLMPAFTIPEADLDTLINAVARVVTDFAARGGAR
jgi:adenosylmethionine-8-amino-7-oxononanoate aminotransferase